MSASNKGSIQIKNRTTPCKPAIFQQLANMEVQNTLDFLELSRSRHKSILDGLQADEFAEDVLEHSNALLSIAEESAVLGLHRVVELITIKIKKMRRATMESNPKFKFQIAHENLIKEEKIPGHAVVKELRLVNNAIKHEGIVSDDELAQEYHKWIVGDPLVDFDSLINGVAPIVPKYLEALATAFLSEMKS
jgi:hypothetical protein